MNSGCGYFRPGRRNVVLSAHALTKTFARGLARSVCRTLALDAVDFELQRGEIVVLAGPEASGKTTLLQCLCGLLRRDDGVVVAFGEKMGATGWHPRIGFVPSVPVFYPFLTVTDALQPNNCRRRTGAAVTDVSPALGSLRLDIVGRTRIAELTRSLVRRLSIGSELVSGADVLLVDSAADGRTYLDCPSVEALVQFARMGGAVMVAGRDVSLIARAANRIVTITEGKLSPSGGWPSSTRFVAERVH